MWIFTPSGFVSGVEDRRDPTVIVVRARDYRSLAAFCVEVSLKPGGITLGEGTDYPYRIRVSRETFASFAYRAAMDVDYANFKDEATRVRGKAYHDVLMSVWVAGLRLTPPRIKAKLAKASRARWSGIDAWLARRADEGTVVGDRPMHSLTDDEWAELESAAP